MSGLTETGFEAKTLEEIQGEIEDDERADIDAGIDLTPEQPLGQINGIMAKKFAELWEVAQILANAMNPNGAENFLLDNVCLLSGTKREPAKRSTVTVTADVDDLFAAAAGQIIINVDGQPDVQFRNRDVVDALTPAGAYPIVFECTEYGPVVAVATTLSVITSPVSGLNTVTNAEDAVLGAFDEKDAPLRQRREDERTATGACTADSIRADILQVPGVRQCYVFQNEGRTTDANGLPGKSFEVVIYDGETPEADDEAIAQVVWDSKPSGSQSVGTVTQTVLDSQGIPRTVKFSRASVVNVWFEYDVTVDSNFFPTTGADLIKLAAFAYGTSALNLGLDVFAVRFKAQALTVTGVLDVPELRLGFSISPLATANLAITGRQIANIDTSRITVAVTAGSP